MQELDLEESRNKESFHPLFEKHLQPPELFRLWGCMMKAIKTARVFPGILAVVIALMTAGSYFAQVSNEQIRKSAISPQSDRGKKPEAAAGNEVIIGVLKSRDKEVTILQGTKGVLYTIKTKAGKILAARIGEGALRTKYPALYDQFQHGLAGNDAAIRQFPEKPVPIPAR